MRILCDTHTHTLHSRHAYSTLEENVRTAAQAGLELLGSTDHFSSMLGPGVGFEGDPDLRDYQFFINQEVWPRVWHGVTVLRGAEADIVDLDGHLFGHGFPQPRNISLGRYKHALDLDERVLGGVDYAIASVHGKGFAEGASVFETTRMYVRALENPKVLILGHIGRSGVDFDVDEVVSAARDLHSKMTECLEVDGVCGTQDHSFAFELGLFRLTLIVLGRLQYEQRVYPGPDCELPGGVTVRAGDRIYGMHIPSGAPLDREACRASYQKAYEFFGCTKERPLIVHCDSWLLNPDHRWMLPESSRIIGFMNDFTPTRTSRQERFTAAWRIYGHASKLPMEQWPEDNALRRGYLRLLREGRPIQTGEGLLLYRGE